MGLFRNPNDPDNQIIRQKIKEWLLEYLAINPSSVISIEEIPCWEPNCPDIFTKIIYTSQGQSQELIIHKPLTFVRKIDIKGLSSKG
jgi:hypothetical protein